MLPRRPDGPSSVRALLGLEPCSGPWTLEVARAELTAAGLTVLDAAEERVPARFTDVAALVAYVRSTPCSVPEFDPDAMRGRLAVVHDRCVRDGLVEALSHRFWVAARSPSSASAGRE